MLRPPPLHRLPDQLCKDLDDVNLLCSNHETTRRFKGLRQQRCNEVFLDCKELVKSFLRVIVDKNHA